MRKWAFKLMRDEALMVQYAKGHNHAFECLYRRHKTRLFNFLQRQCDNRAICEELNQKRCHVLNLEFRSNI